MICYYVATFCLWQLCEWSSWQLKYINLLTGSILFISINCLKSMIQVIVFVTLIDSNKTNLRQRLLGIDLLGTMVQNYGIAYQLKSNRLNLCTYSNQRLQNGAVQLKLSNLLWSELKLYSYLCIIHLPFISWILWIIIHLPFILWILWIVTPAENKFYFGVLVSQKLKSINTYIFINAYFTNFIENPMYIIWFLFPFLIS